MNFASGKAWWRRGIYRVLRGCLSTISFLGLKWVDGILDHTKTAKERTQISTASYNQVTQTIYKTAKGRWSNYEDKLSEILPKLDPYIKKFGY